MKSPIKLILALFCLGACQASADGHSYFVRIVDPSHVFRYSSDDFYLAHDLLDRKLLGTPFGFSAEVFIVPSGPGYRVVVGQKENKLDLSGKDLDVIESLVRDALIEAKRINAEKAKPVATSEPHKPTSEPHKPTKAR